MSKNTFLTDDHFKRQIRDALISLGAEYNLTIQDMPLEFLYACYRMQSLVPPGCLTPGMIDILLELHMTSYIMDRAGSPSTPSAGGIKGAVHD